MPLYEYTCQKCHSDFELLIRGSEQPKCPDCGSAKLEKHFSVPAAHTRGSSSLPVCSPESAGGCGLPQCGMGGCQMM
jgi:putative FmdB family regulatory protein